MTIAARQADDREVTRTLYDISHVLGSTKGGDQRVLRALELVRELVPYNQCALLELTAGHPSRVVVTPQVDKSERIRLADRLMTLVGRLVEEHTRDPDAIKMPTGTHLAVPLFDGHEVSGVLFVRLDHGAYSVSHLRALSIVAANLGAYLALLHARATEFEQAVELDQARQRMQHLYEISKVLTAFETVERTVPSIIAIMARTLPLHSAVLILGTTDRHHIVWTAEGETEHRCGAACARAQSSYGYFVGPAVEPHGEEDPFARPSVESPSRDDERSFILLPLVDAHRRIFGALQIEAVASLDELDLVFTNAVVNQLAIALDRQATIDAAQATTEARRAAAEDRKVAAEERQAAAEVREAVTSTERNWLKAVLDQMPAGVLIGEAPTGKVIVANQRAHSIRPGARYDEAGFPLARSIATGEVVVDEEGDFVRDDGTRGTLLVSSTPIRDRDGRIVSGVETFYDITDRKRDERAQRFLSEAGDRLAQSLDPTEKLAAIASLAVPELADWCVVHAVSESGELQPLSILHADPAKVTLAREMLRRYPPAANRDALLHEVLHSSEAQLFAAISDEMLAANTRDGEHLRMLRELALQSAMVVPLLARGRVIGELSLASSESGRRFDHSDLKLAQELARRAGTAIENAQLYVQARRASRARDEVLAVVSHDLKNPLSSIMMSASMLSQTLPVDENGRKWVASIDRAARRMNWLIGNLLDVVTIEAGSLVIEKTRHGVVSLVQDAIEMQHTLAAAKALVLETEIRAGGDVDLFCDRERVLQVFANLIGNAIKFTPPGGSITVRVETNGPEVQFAVADTGPGIPQEALSRVFDRFWQAQKTARLGTGLGLSIARGIVEAHGGRIWVESQVGIGTTFFFALELGSSDGETHPSEIP